VAVLNLGLVTQCVITMCALWNWVYDDPERRKFLTMLVLYF